jgi:hypothetical protein
MTILGAAAEMSVTTQSDIPDTLEFLAELR